MIAFLGAVRSGGVPAVDRRRRLASLEIAIRCLETPAKARAASPARKGPAGVWSARA